MAITFLPVSDNAVTSLTAKAKVMGKTLGVGDSSQRGENYYPYNKYNGFDETDHTYADIT